MINPLIVYSLAKAIQDDTFRETEGCLDFISMPAGSQSKSILKNAYGLTSSAVIGFLIVWLIVVF